MVLVEADQSAGPVLDPRNTTPHALVRVGLEQLVGGRLAGAPIRRRDSTFFVLVDSDRVLAQQHRTMVAAQLRSMEARCPLPNNLANDVVEPAGRPNTDRVGNKCDAATLAQLWEARRRLLQQLDAAEFNLLQRAAVPEQPIQPRPGRPKAIGMLFGLLASAVLVWWLTHRQGADGFGA